MCVIFDILPGNLVEDEKLYNAAANNWHSWGLVAIDTEKKFLHIYKEVPKGADLDENHPEAGGVYNDLERIKELLSKHIGMQRFLHFRHATKGKTNLDNAHPFEVYDDGTRQVVLMHNGTFMGLGGDRGAAWQGTGVHQRMAYNGSQCNDDSDTKEFIDKFLKEPLAEFVKGDYTNPTFKKFVWDKLWSEKGSSSRVALISNDLPPLKAGTWNTFIGNESRETIYYTSNNDYFQRVSRGPIFCAAKKAEAEAAAKQKAQEAEKNQGVGTQGSASTALTQVGRSLLGPTPITITNYVPGLFQPDPQISRGLLDIFKTFGENLQPGDVADLYYCSHPEFLSIVEILINENNKEAIASLLDRVIREHAEAWDAATEMSEKIKKLEVKLKDSSKMVASLKARFGEGKNAKAA